MGAIDPLRRLQGGLRMAGALALDALLPPACYACNAPVAAQGGLCADCFQRIGFISAPFCACCGVPFIYAAQAGSAGRCPTCTESPPKFARARAALRYDAESRRLVLPLKYNDRTELAAALAPLMARAGAALLADADLLVPVPLHRWRLFHRRYNQSALLARAIARIAHRPAALDALVRLRHTAPLAEKSARARREEVAGAFAVRPRRAARIAGRRVLLIDDVLTSGATANACATALTEAGATAVDLLVAAKVPDPRLE